MNTAPSTKQPGAPMTGAAGVLSSAPGMLPGRLLRVLRAVLDVMFGARDDDPDLGLGAAISQDNVQVDLRPARTPRGELLLNALGQAIAEYHYTFLRPYRRYSPNFTFQLHQVCLVRTLDNMTLLADFDRLRREQRNLILKAKFREFDGFDLTEFSDVRIEDEVSGAADPVVVVAGEGASRARLGVEFHGEFVERSTTTQPSSLATFAPADQEQRQSGCKSNRSSQVQTLVPRACDTADANVILHITEPQQPQRSVTLSHFPARLGRSEDCDVVINCGYVSRLHATLLHDQTSGDFQLVGHSRAGTAMAGVPLSADTEVTLADGAEFTLSSSSPVGGVLVRVELRVPLPLLPASQVATLMPRPSQDDDAARTTKSSNLNLPARSNDEMAASRTLMEREAARASATAERQPVARLRVRSFDGDTQVYDILMLPFEIGREPGGANCCLISEDQSRVSRQHLRFVRYQAGALTVSNMAHASNGTWVKNERMPERFTLKPVDPNSADGWCLLGEPELGRRSAAIRLEAAQ